MTSSPEQLRQLAMDALEELKAVDIKCIDVRELTTITDYMVVCTGRSDRQVRSIAENVIATAKASGHTPLGIEGERDGEWALVDLVDVVIQVMNPETRELYQLEKLWEKPARLRAMSAADAADAVQVGIDRPAGSDDALDGASDDEDDPQNAETAAH
jgi:ribosome-associated protein